MTDTEKSQIFKKELSYIGSALVKDLTKNMIELIPNYFFEIAASSTNKYHPDYALGSGGLVRHTKAAIHFAKILREINVFGLSSLEFDCAIAALILHDSRKSGVSDETKSQHTRFDHPILAESAILMHFRCLDAIPNAYIAFNTTKEECCKIHELIATAVVSHMGQWNTSKYSPDITLPIPKTALQLFVHTCDYLASRKDLDIKNMFNVI